MPRWRSRSIRLWQALTLFLLVVVVGTILAWRIEVNQDRLADQQRSLELQQAQIAETSRQIADAQYQSCVGGRVILETFNRQQDMLAELERQQTVLPKLQKQRIKAYKDARILPLPECRFRGTR